MNAKARGIIAALLLGGIGVAGYAYYRGEVMQAAMLQEFAALEARLAVCKQQNAKTAANTIKGIAYNVRQNLRQARDIEVLRQSEEIHARSRSLNDTLQALRQQMRSSGKTKATLTPPVADGLVTHLNRFVRFIQQYIPGAESLTQIGPVPASAAEFNRFYFEKAPAGAALAALSRLETQVRRLENEALDKQAEKVGSRCTFDKLVAVGVPESETVFPGSVYQARLLLAHAASSFRPLEMTANGIAVLTGLGEGRVKFRIPPYQAGQPDTVRAQWQGTIRTEAPTDTTWRIAVPYLIVKQPAR